MTQARNDKHQADSQPSNAAIAGMVLGMSVGMSLGAGIGVIASVMLGQSWLWLSTGASIGLGVGLCLGAVLGKNGVEATNEGFNAESNSIVGLQVAKGDAE